MFDQAEKNRAAALANNLQKGSSGPMRLYVGSLHFNITEDMLRGIFEPFGRVNSAMYFFSNFILYYDLVFIHVDVSFFTQIDSIQLMMDSETGRSKGYGFITVSCVVELCWCRISDITRQVVGVKLQKQLFIFSRAY